jgi:hypothetical protein
VCVDTVCVDGARVDAGALDAAWWAELSLDTMDLRDAMKRIGASSHAGIFRPCPSGSACD